MYTDLNERFVAYLVSSRFVPVHVAFSYLLSLSSDPLVRGHAKHIANVEDVAGSIDAIGTGVSGGKSLYPVFIELLGNASTGRYNLVKAITSALERHAAERETSTRRDDPLRTVIKHLTEAGIRSYATLPAPRTTSGRQTTAPTSGSRDLSIIATIKNLGTVAHVNVDLELDEHGRVDWNVASLWSGAIAMALFQGDSARYPTLPDGDKTLVGESIAYLARCAETHSSNDFKTLAGQMTTLAQQHGVVLPVGSGLPDMAPGGPF